MVFTCSRVGRPSAATLSLRLRLLLLLELLRRLMVVNGGSYRVRIASGTGFGGGIG